MPTDDAVSFKSGARFGPEAIRSASVLLRPYNPRLRVDVVERLSMVDYGDAPTVPGYHLETLERIEAFLRPVHEAGVVPLCLGGDHSMVLAELRGGARDARPARARAPRRARRRLGPVLRRQVLPRDGVQARGRGGPRSTRRSPSRPGMRGTLYGESDVAAPAAIWAIDAIYMEELETLSPAEYGERVRARVGDAPAFLSFDVDFVDPAFAPGHRHARRSAARRAARRWPTCAR